MDPITRFLRSKEKLNEFFDWRGIDSENLSNKKIKIKSSILTIYWESKYTSSVDESLTRLIVNTINSNWKNIEDTARKEFRHHLYEVFSENDKPTKEDEDEFISLLSPTSCMIYFLRKNKQYDGFSLDLSGKELSKKLDNRRLEVEFNADGDLENDYFVVR